ncbi:MAG: hypothetical protein M1405_00035 [Patescibacteria group bacterium]|nr:hypothetical protein [Patescibacteria group bacterium]
MKKNLLIFLLLFGVAYFFTNGFLNTFFQQDEWNGFGLVTYLSHQPIWAWFNMLTGQHLVPFTSSSWLVFYRIFGFEAGYYALTSLLLHTFAAFLVYYFIKSLSKDTVVSLLTALLFITNSRASLAFIHLAVFSNTIPCLILIILFFLYLGKIIQKKIYGKKDAGILAALFLTAVFFREDAFILIPLLPIYIFIYNRKALVKQNLPFFSIFYAFAVTFFIFRFVMQLVNPIALNVSNKSYLTTYLYNAITFPVKLVIQNLFEGYYTIQMFIYQHSQLLYPVQLSAEVINTIYLDLVFLAIFNVVAVVSFIVFRGIKDKSVWKNIYFFIAWILIDALLLASVGRRMNLIEGRYLYLSSVAVLFILSVILVKVYRSGSPHLILGVFKKMLVIIVIIGFLISSYLRMQKDIKTFETQGQVRKQILSGIMKVHPAIPKNTIFFVKCKDECYRNSEFGVSNSLVLPFSSGPGWIIMLYYSRQNEKAYAPFFTRFEGETELWDWKVGRYTKVKNQDFLWDMGAQGYRKIGDYSFGYFVSEDFLRETIKKNNLNKNIVIGLEYDEKNFKIEDISNRIRNEL